MRLVVLAVIEPSLSLSHLLSCLHTSLFGTWISLPTGSLNRVPASAGVRAGTSTSAGWQVTLCDPMWHVSSRSSIPTLRTAIHLLLSYLPAYMALCLHVNTSPSRPPDCMWHHQPGCPWNKWLDQLWDDYPSQRRPVELWCRPWTRWCSDVTALASYTTMMKNQHFHGTGRNTML